MSPSPRAPARDFSFEGGRVFVIAEAGSNWRMGTVKRDLQMARALIDVATESGADAVKFQTYRARTVYAPNAGSSHYLAEAGIHDPIHQIFEDLSMPYEMVAELAAYCRKTGIGFMSTAFSTADFAAIDPFVAVHKIASYEISHLRLIECAAGSGKPLILSTGASTEGDIQWAVDHFRARSSAALCLMQCTARYPAPLESLHLRVIPWLRDRFEVIAGLSDHSRSPIIGPVVAVALGARVIEKHFTLHNRLPGPDHGFALSPTDLSEMIRVVRQAELALGSGDKVVLPEEDELARFARRGIQALREISAGEELHEDDNVAILRPGERILGAHPRILPEIEGKVATRTIPAGEGLQPGDWK
ncbi:MAG: N-acetylneuraminate synthase family protein [Myxococcota bacterium]